MCEMCEAAVDVFKNRPIKGWNLVRATRNGEYMLAGDLGLVRQNNPVIYWQSGDIAEYANSWDRQWKSIRRTILKHGLCGFKVSSITKDPQELQKAIVFAINEWHQTQPFVKDENPITPNYSKGLWNR